MENKNKLVERLKQKCSVRELTFDDIELLDEIESAICVVNNRRRFVPTDKRPYEKKYEDLIIRLALFSLTKIGAEGEVTHSENAVTRVYDSSSEYPTSLLSEIIPLVR